VRAFFAPAPRSPHPASAARLLTSPAGRGKEAGFSLIELAIVLVILGLLVGGILVGQSLIRAAEMRSVSTDYNKFSVALRTFQDKYFTLPGDMTNATAFWGGGLASCQNTVGTGTATCNGDGDGYIDYTNGATGTAVDNHYEGLRAWQHLANAGLIESSYTGADTVPGGLIDFAPGINVPDSRIGGRWQILSAPTAIFRPWAPNRNGDFLLLISAVGEQPVFSAQEGWSLDTKLDDSKPYTGLMQDIREEGALQYTPNCATAENTSADYNLSVSGINCAAFIQVLK
jgi:prepilin-type N-terminal cleavage/methylation domain-containing protein